MPIPSFRPSALLAFTAVAIVTVFAWPAPAQAQVPSTFAEPLSSADLARWTQRLELRGDARRAAEAAFERALAEAQALRDGDMATFARDAGIENDPAVTIEEIEQRARRAKALAARQAAIENRLFNELAALVPESKQEIVEAERRAATRRRCAATLDLFQRTGIVPDLVELMHTARIAPSSDEARALVLDYDRRLTDRLQRVAAFMFECGPAIRRATDAASARMAAEAPAAAGDADGAAPPDPGRVMGDRFRIFREARAEALAPFQEMRREIVGLHRATFDQLRRALPPKDAGELRRLYVHMHYPILGMGRDAPEPILSRARALAAEDGTVPAELLESAERLLEAYRERVEAIERRMMDALDARRGEMGAGPMMSFGDDGGFSMVRDDDLDELRSERREAAAAVRSTIAALHPALAVLGAESSSELPLPSEQPPGVRRPPVAARATVVTNGPSGPETFSFEVDSNIAARVVEGPIRPIAPREFDAMAARLGLSGTARDHARAAYDAYRDAAEAEIARALGTPAEGAAAGRAATSVFVAGGNVLTMSGEAPPKAALDGAVARLAEADEAFFAGLGVADDPALARERGIRARERLRQRLALGAGPVVQPWGRFDRVELQAIVAEMPLPDELREPVDTIVSAHADRMTALLARLLAAQDAMRETEATFARTRVQSDGRIARSVGVTSGGDDARTRAIVAVGDASRSVNAEMRRTLDELRARLPADAARRIRRGAYAQAMPALANDPRSAEERLEQAIMLETISDETRLALVELLASHQGAVDALLDRFVDDAEREERHADALRGPGAGPAPGAGPIAVRAMRSSGGLQQRLRFDRNELNDATMRRLRALLTREENARIPDLRPAQRGMAPAMPF